MQECLTPTCSQGFEAPPVEVVGPVDGTSDGFDSGGDGPEGIKAAGKNRPLELNPSASSAQPVNQAESPYQGAFWKDSQDFAAGVEDVPESARVEQAAQAHAVEMESRRFAELAEQPFSLTGRQELRA